jgi:hypothetical protein
MPSIVAVTGRQTLAAWSSFLMRGKTMFVCLAIVEVNQPIANNIRQPRLVRASRYSDGGEGGDSLRSSVLISNFWFGTRSTSVLKV